MNIEEFIKQAAELIKKLDNTQGSHHQVNQLRFRIANRIEEIKSYNFTSNTDYESEYLDFEREYNKIIEEEKRAKIRAESRVREEEEPKRKEPNKKYLAALETFLRSYIDLYTEKLKELSYIKVIPSTEVFFAKFKEWTDELIKIYPIDMMVEGLSFIISKELYCNLKILAARLLILSNHQDILRNHKEYIPFLNEKSNEKIEFKVVDDQAPREVAFSEFITRFNRETNPAIYKSPAQLITLQAVPIAASSSSSSSLDVTNVVEEDNFDLFFGIDFSQVTGDQDDEDLFAGGVMSEGEKIAPLPSFDELFAPSPLVNYYGDSFVQEPRSPSFSSSSSSSGNTSKAVQASAIDPEMKLDNGDLFSNNGAPESGKKLGRTLKDLIRNKITTQQKNLKSKELSDVYIKRIISEFKPRAEEFVQLYPDEIAIKKETLEEIRKEMHANLNFLLKDIFVRNQHKNYDKDIADADKLKFEVAMKFQVSEFADIRARIISKFNGKADLQSAFSLSKEELGITLDQLLNFPKDEFDRIVDSLRIERTRREDDSSSSASTEIASTETNPVKKPPRIRKKAKVRDESTDVSNSSSSVTSSSSAASASTQSDLSATDQNKSNNSIFRNAQLQEDKEENGILKPKLAALTAREKLPSEIKTDHLADVFVETQKEFEYNSRLFSKIDLAKIFENANKFFALISDVLSSSVQATVKPSENPYQYIPLTEYDLQKAVEANANAGLAFFASTTTADFLGVYDPPENVEMIGRYEISV